MADGTDELEPAHRFGPFELGPRQPGRPPLFEVGTLLVLAALLVFGAVTPRHDARGQANAPLQTFFVDRTGGGLCFFKRVTGIPCAGCGITRGVVATLHGDLGDAVSLNPLAPPLVVWVVWRLAQACALVFARRRLENRLPWRVAWWLYGAAFLAAVGLGIWRVAAHFLGYPSAL